MDKYSKIFISRVFLTLGLLLQLLLIIKSGVAKISSLSFIILGISAVCIFLAETEEKHKNPVAFFRLVNVFLFLAISALAYKLNHKFI
jgi:uncharacterized protein with PQ loop repeat